MLKLAGATTLYEGSVQSWVHETGGLTLLAEMLTRKQQREDDDELIDSLTQDVLHHGARDQGLVAAVRLPQQQGLGRRLSGQGQ